MKIKIEIARADKSWNAHKKINKSLIKEVSYNILNYFENLKAVKHYELSILFTDNSQMLALNQSFCKKPYVTNVLSFPEINLNYEQLLEFKPNLNYMYLGDIAFGYQIIVAEALAQNKSFENHFMHLLIHSIFHLLGFDHVTGKQEKIMKKYEVAILQNFNIPSPY